MGLCGRWIEVRRLAVVMICSLAAQVSFRVPSLHESPDMFCLDGKRDRLASDTRDHGRWNPWEIHIGHKL